MFTVANAAAEQELEDIIAAADFRRLGEIAIAELLGNGAREIACGPITTGGLGSAEKNMAVFDLTIQQLMEFRRPMFNQIPYENPLKRMEGIWAKTKAKGEYCSPILDDFYLPLFQTRRFQVAWFIPGWESSVGATWERGVLNGLGVECRDITEEWLGMHVLSRL